MADTSHQEAATGKPVSSIIRRKRWAFFWQQIPTLTARQWRVFAVSTTAGFFDVYDGGLLSLALSQIQHGLSIAESQLGGMLSVIRLGYLASFLISPLADVFGRRQVLLYTIIGYTLFTGLSAIAPHERGFVAAQFVTRAFSGAEATISLVILAEELDAAVRGWVIGLQGALQISGYGLAAIVFALINVIPYGWRGLYALGLVPLIFVIPLRRLLPESKRFEAEQRKKAAPASLLQPLSALFMTYPTRLSAVVAVAFLNAIGASPALFLLPKYLQEAHGWSAPQVSSLIVFGGALGVLGSIFGGQISDRRGRRASGALFMIFGPLLTIWVYNARSNMVAAVWILRLFFDTAAGTILGVYSAELFPTSHRSAAASAQIVAGTTGGALGLFLEELLYRLLRSHWEAVSALTSFWVAAALLMYLCYPETAGQELEAISPEAS
jgi:putative MFS transporter